MRNILINFFLISGYVLAGLLTIPGKTHIVAAADIKQEKRVILALGDSLTAGFGVEEEESFPSRIQMKIDKANLGFKVVNAGISGDTTAGGVRRIDWLMKHKPNIVILALGANDGLRGLSTEEMRANLEAMIRISHKHNARVLLAGMKALPNYGEDYQLKFESIYPELAEEYGLVYLPFLLEGVAGVREHTRPDGLHPTASGYKIVADLVWQYLQPMLNK
ncbi:MAG: arylesterase [Nitrospinae bacterium]|nr:arylesterase [Nitrospinota bacterium]